ncbi:MAG: PAS domain-containing protein [Alphaproteobacteria bacterium]|nr:MAG: PAS domain-containing protein [Alphaproteobacteria bacterium]
MVWRQRARVALAQAEAAADRAARAEARLAAVPDGLAILHRSNGAARPERLGTGGRIELTPRLAEVLGLDLTRPIGCDELVAAFDDAAGEKLRTALDRLCAEGTGFELILPCADGRRTCAVVGAVPGEAAGAGDEALVWFRDVSPLACDLAAAEAARDTLAAVLDAVPVPIWRRDADLNLIYCNRAYAAAVELDPDEAMTQAVEILGKARGGTLRALARRALETGAPAAERHHVVIGGARRLLEVEERPFGDDTTLGHAVDRTEAEDLAAELKRHVAAHAEVLESLASAIAIFGPDMRLTFFNTAYTRLWALDESYLASKPTLSDILEVLREARRLPEQANFPEYKRQWLRTLQTLIDPVEELLHLPDGTTLRSVASPHPFGGVLFIYEDVTDRLTLERSYNTLIEVQRETLDNLFEGVAVYGADGRLKLSNPAFARIWNLPPEVLEGEPHVRELIEYARSYYDLDDEAWVAFRESRVARATEPDFRSGRRTRADGIVIDWTQVPLPDGASLFTFVDVTDSLRVERALRERAEALETADRLKSEFIANISYELRTPLNAIVGFAEILENQFFGPLNERQVEYSRAIVEASQRLISLINDILDLATIEAGYMELEQTDVDVRELLDSVRTLGQERARTRNIELRVECPADIGRIEADPRRLKQALFNLLSNAFKFTPEGGVVTVEAARDGNDLVLSVSDTGIGISAEDLDRVFGKFERGSAQAGHSGAGLGLSLVKSLIELHGGRVTLDSRPDEGTRVTCRIPIAAGTRAPGDDSTRAALGGARPRT